MFYKPIASMIDVQDISHTVYRGCVSMLLSPCSQTMNAQYIVTNIGVGIMVILQVQTSSTVLSATVVTQVLTVSDVMCR